MSSVREQIRLWPAFIEHESKIYADQYWYRTGKCADDWLGLRY